VPAGSKSVTDRAPELLVIGGGAGGLSAARTARRRGARVALVEAGRLGGDCTFTGCVPSKTLLAGAARGDSFEKAMTTVHATVERIAATEDDETLRREGIEVVHGRARFTGRGAVDVDGVRWTPRHTVIATGGHPTLPSVPGLDQVGALTSDTVFSLHTQPRRLGVLGGGAVGCELGQAFARLGTAVTIIEAERRLLPAQDPDTSDVIATVLAREHVEVRTGSRLRAATRANNVIRLDVDTGDPVEVDAVLVAVGRSPTIDGLGLDAAGVRVERGAIVVDDTLATTAKGVWAVGDVTGGVQLTHAADEMGRIAVANALGRGHHRRFRAHTMPSVVFTDPEIARVGPTLAELAGRTHRVAQLPLTAVDRAITSGATDGFVRLVAGPRPLLRNLGGGRLLAGTVVAPRAGELISEVALAVQTAMFTGRLAQTVHPYPSWSIALRQAAAQFFMEIDGRRAR
jgi:pyruvate/2-oxoglutarate dehydrogenase complex dihydrolipoamide dehydrogenase (E3) component